ncbi:beta-glucosidase BglX [Sphingomonas donggukensis]|uniref:beta-glucosidase n=1 Tax=Sphingomonas donggukensis TaxID=2949093 RepID=A0ABY4TSV6_9SPHN|nr:beta-glucosidase BglX [Sphingomonas donggukensis]URW75485.1 beta-glucosidase BglX [Sphingomonas donggukensis]
MPIATARRLLTGASLIAALVATPLAARDAPVAQARTQAAVPQGWGDTPAMTTFVDALIAKMTLAEKIGQLTLLTSDWVSTGPTLRAGYKEDVAAGKVGAIFNAHSVAYTRELQKLAVEGTRLKIPLIFGYDVIHGHRTIFPISLGEAASWDLAAIEKSARISATEAAAEGLHWTFAPMVDISRDPRWGRISEGAGEDTYLGSRIAEARVKGFQGKRIGDTDAVLATVKHFAAYGAPQAGRDYSTVDMSMRELRDTYLPPYKAAIDAGAATVMTSFNEVDGVPASGNHFLMTDVLRNEWGFKGFVVTDFTSINEMVPHGYAKDEKQAGEQAINAGVDMDMQGAVYLNHLAKSVAEGKVSVATIDTAVRRVLEMKYRLGLFTDPYRFSDAKREKANVMTPAFLAAARDVARRSMVLLKNDRDALPIASSAKRIAVVGPLGDSKADMIGSWAGQGDRTTKPVSVLEGIRARAGKGVTVTYAKGASYAFADAAKTDGFAEAMAAARDADVIVAAMGEHWDMTGEAASRTSLDLPGNQEALLKQLKTLGKPIVLVLLSGRPNTVAWAAENVDAILEAWYPGTMGGHAVADVLFGDYNPSGKLPVTFPRSVGQVPIYYAMKNTGRPYEPKGPEQKYRSRYLDSPNTPQWPFGYGLSYTSFGYSPVTLDRATIRPGQTLTASVTLTNTGKRVGTETVQLYTRDLVGSVTRPLKELKGFRQITLKPGEARRVSFTVSDKDLAFHRADMSWGAEAGDFDLFIGGSSDVATPVRFTLSE